MKKLTPRQRIIVMVVPLGILAVGIIGHALFGTVALVIPPVLACVFLAYLVIEARHYAQLLFARQLHESRATYRQWELLYGMSEFLRPVHPLPPTRGWAASPDLLREIMTHVLENAPDCVVEASSGTSTVIIGYCLQRLGKGKVYALEHDPVYAARTRRALELHGLTAFAEVIDAPLVEHAVGGARHEWYDLKGLQTKDAIGLLVVDGPPETVQSQARYPAVPLLRDRLAPGAVVLLDDGGRADERATAARWANECPGSEVKYLDLEAGAWWLRMPFR
ncbi:MAG: class I SAM-dependent methyltransferase [Flavobacteriales bacterium]|nr:class I SAM-dependent methyltransferase [Flavobacteriales bacterium]